MSAERLNLLRDAAHIVSHRRVVGALLDTLGRSLWRGRPGAPSIAPPPLPGPELTERVTSPSPRLVRDYARFLGASADAYRSPATVPAHLFPQWTFPLAARVLRDVPYNLTRILNAGCRLEINAQVPASSPLTVRAMLVDVQDDGRRALLHQRIVTDTPSHPEALVADIYAVAPVSRQKNGRSERDAGRVPADAREVTRFHFGRRAGLTFAFLTGDFNPVHWAPAYARAAGFATPILHGFAVMAHTLEGLGRALFAGATARIRTVDVKFKRPLVLGAGVDVGLYLDRARPDTFYLAEAPGVRAYLTGSFEAHARDDREAGDGVTARQEPAGPVAVALGAGAGAGPVRAAGPTASVSEPLLGGPHA
jgi:acyl dehydratase